MASSPTAADLISQDANATQNLCMAYSMSSVSWQVGENAWREFLKQLFMVRGFNPLQTAFISS
jgi:hypothetical protein